MDVECLLLLVGNQIKQYSNFPEMKDSLFCSELNESKFDQIIEKNIST